MKLNVFYFLYKRAGVRLGRLGNGFSVAQSVAAVLGCLVLIGAISLRADWRSQMLNLKVQLEELVPLVGFDNAPTLDKKAYLKKVIAIRDGVQSLDKELKQHVLALPDSDHSLPFLLKAFKRQTERAVEGLEGGEIAYARDLYRSSVAFCVACHTRNGTGVQYSAIQSLGEAKGKKTSVNWLDKMMLLTASRQFDDAIADFKSEIAKPPKESKMKPAELEKGTRLALTVAIKAKKDPALAKEILKLVKASPVPSMTTKGLADTWSADVDLIAKNPAANLSGDVKKRTPKQLMDFTKELVDPFIDRESVQGFPAADIKFIAVSGMMHDLLAMPKAKEYRPEAYLYLGIANEALAYLGIWSLHEVYYEACIEARPHTELAQKCYNRYKKSLSFDYSGTVGDHLLTSVQKQIEHYRSLAEAKGKSE